MKRAGILITLLLAACGLRSQSAAAASFTLNPAADAFVTTGPTGLLSTNNYGGAGTLAVSAAGLSQGEFQSILMFNLAAAKSAFDGQFGAGQWSLQSVTLQLTATPPNNAIYNASAAGQLAISWMSNDSWTEGSGNPNTPGTTGITFNTLLTLTGGSDEGLGVFSFSGATSGSPVYTLGIPGGFTADLMAGNNVTLRLFAADSSVSGVFNSRNFGTVANRPLLTVTAVPEPGAGVLGLGLLGLFLRRPKTKNSEGGTQSR